jgi:acetyl esterase
MMLDPEVRARVAHLHGASWADLLTGAVVGPAERVPAPVPGVTHEDTSVGHVPVRVYRPDAEPIATVVWVHGGAWMFGGLDMPEAHAVADRVAAWLPATVISVDYRLAPAHTHPAALEDVVAVARHYRPDILGGGSAGGHLSALAVHQLPDVRVLWLAYPATDPANGPYPAARDEECPEVLWLDGAVVPGIFATYLAGADTAAATPAALPLSEYPPTLVTTARYDALADQAVRFVELLHAAGVTAELEDEPTLLHGYLNMCGDLPAADAALRRHVDTLRRLLGP